MHRPSRGFTLLELMLVVSIIGILAAVALPAYNDYVVRARVTEGLELGMEARKSVAAYHDRWGVLPADNTAAGLPAPEALHGSWVSAIEIVRGALVITFGPGLNTRAPTRKEGEAASVGQALVLRPAVPSDHPTGALAWVCQDGATPPHAQAVPMPTGLRLLEAKYLPAPCRGTR